MKPQITDEDFENLTTRMVLEYAATAPERVLHQMAMQWNGDHAFLEWLVNRPETDKATAVMIYWMSGPRWWKQYDSLEDIKEKNAYSSGFEFTEGLEAKIVSGFYTNQQFAFDPAKDHFGTIWTNEYLDKQTVRDIPTELFQSLIGELVEEPAGFEEGMPPELVAKLEAEYEKYEIID